MRREPHEFDPARAPDLDRPERQEFLPDEKVLDLLALEGGETVVDYGAGSGTLTLPLAHRLPRGSVHAVENSPEMMDLLRDRLRAEGFPNARAHLVEDDRIPLADGTADRILAANFLHHVIGTRALAEMRRLLAPDGFLLVVDWRTGVEREYGPPRDVALSSGEGREVLEEAGFEVASLAEHGFPYHFVLRARRTPSSIDAN